MSPSKLENYEAILEVLANKPLRVDAIAYKLNTSCTVVKERINFLLEHGLLKECYDRGWKLYAITERGKAVLRILRLQRSLERIAAALKMINQVIESHFPASQRVNDDSMINEA
ncbi:MAG: winged helix-turn-helix domain-containing protein [Candidatus Bathyarchaeia archaeon]|nr:hypothetical protein [Candidatus Bathyarchaeota archaeon]